MSFSVTGTCVLIAVHRASTLDMTGQLFCAKIQNLSAFVVVLKA